MWKEGETPEEIKAHNIRRVFEMLDAAGGRGSDVAVFGEYANVRHLPFDAEHLRKYGDPVPGALSERLGEAAERYSMNVVAPIVGLCDGKVRNTTLILDRKGTLVGQYFKAHLPAPEADAGIAAGEDIPVFELDFGQIGVMTCMDVEYPEHALTLMLRCAEMIFFPHVQSSWGEVDWEIRYRARAVDTGLYLVSACYGIRDEDGWRPGMMMGRSGIIGRDGAILAEASRYVEVLTREIDLDRKRISDFHFARPCDRTTAVMASRRPELYGDLVQARFRDEARQAAERWTSEG